MRSSIRLLGATLAVGTCLAAVPSPARAWWVRGGYWGPRVVVAPAPVVVAPPPVFLPPPPAVAYYPPPPRRFWVPAHYNRFGAWIPGHWA